MNAETQVALFKGLLIEAGVVEGRDYDRIGWDPNEGPRHRDDGGVYIVNWRCDSKLVGRAFQLLAEARGEHGACPRCWGEDRADACINGDCTNISTYHPRARYPYDVRCAD